MQHEYFPYPGKSQDAAEYALQESEQGREVYHTTHLLTTRKRVKESAAQVWALWADLDGAPIPENPKPTAVIESSPGRFHAYWRLSKPLDPEQAESLNRRLTYAIGADKAKWALATLLRPPQTTNYKRPDPTQAIIVSLDAGREDDPDELGAFAPAEPNPNGYARNGHGGSPTDEPPVRLSRSDLRVWRGELAKHKVTGDVDRSASLFKIGAVLGRAGASEQVIAEALRERDETLGWNKYTDRPNDAQYATIAAKVATEDSHDATYEPDTPAFNLTDLGNSERLIAHHGDDLRYVHPWNKWLAWDGKRWKPDTTGEVERRTRATVRGIYAEAEAADDKDERRAIARHATTSESRGRIDAMIALARSMVPATPDDLDRDPWLLNVENGTLDLRTGELREHRREDLITKIAAVVYDPNAKGPRFLQFLGEVFEGDEELISFVRRFAGYSLTGSTEERVFAILHGRGKNGKTTLVELLEHVMGDYATTTDTETILAKRYQGVGNDVAALKGARFVATAEVERGRALAESKVKSLTGNDTVTARFLYAEPFSFRPEFKLWLSTNNKPVIRGTDDAIWDRIRLIPFAKRFEGAEADPRLPEKLRAETPGVLAWMVQGCAEWRRGGLSEPEKVAAATTGYRAEMDALAAFIDEECIVRPEAWCKFADLYTSYTRWCEESNEQPEKKRRFADSLTERGFESDNGAKNVAIRRGIALRYDADPDPSGVNDSPTKPGPEPSDPASGEGGGVNPSVPRLTIGDTQKSCKTGISNEGVNEGYPKSDDLELIPREGGVLGNTLTIVNSLTQEGDEAGAATPRESTRRRLTDEEVERVKRLRAEGMSPKWARKTVLAGGHPLDCECEVCA
jgi:P4 family phage/plasmid primase-like protien